MRLAVSVILATGSMMDFRKYILEATTTRKMINPAPNTARTIKMICRLTADREVTYRMTPRTVPS